MTGVQTCALPIYPTTGLSTRLLDFLAAFDELLDFAVANEVDLVLFAGDAYKSRDPNQTQQRAFAQRIARLTAAGIPCSGPKGMFRAQGLAILFARVVRTFIDDDEDKTRTMAELDRALTSGERCVSFLNGLCRFVPKPGRRSRRYRDEEEAEAA